MPYLSTSTYPGPPWYQFTPNLETIWPGALRRIRGLRYERERLELSDGDFVDLDWVDRGQRRLVILTHGLEGNSERHYMKGMAKAFREDRWDVLAWNCRSCSGEMNRKLRLYFHGEIGDLGEVVEHALRTKDYECIVLVGFSMGGNILLKYLGERADDLPACVAAGIAFSAPVDLVDSVVKLDTPELAFYRKRFYQQLRPKVIHKARQFPNLIKAADLDKVRTWRDFDRYFSAPINGFSSPDELYRAGSAIRFVGPIRVPSLLVNAQNDPILSPSCFPEALARQHPYLYLEAPRRGGHVGFCLPRTSVSWAERRALDFVHEKL